MRSAFVESDEIVDEDLGEQREVGETNQGTVARNASAPSLRLSERQVRRLYRAFVQDSAAGLVSRRRGRPSARRLPGRDTRAPPDPHPHALRRLRPHVSPPEAHGRARPRPVRRDAAGVDGTADGWSQGAADPATTRRASGAPVSASSSRSTAASTPGSRAEAGVA